MTTAALDTIDRLESAISHSRPRDAKKLLTQLRAELVATTVIAPAAPKPTNGGTPAAAKPAAPPPITLTYRRHRVFMNVIVDTGISFRCPVPPRPGMKLDLFLSSSTIYNVFLIGPAVARCEEKFAQLCDQFKDWSLDRIP